jgi:hypothetical protein
MKKASFSDNMLVNNAKENWLAEGKESGEG